MPPTKGSILLKQGSGKGKKKMEAFGEVDRVRGKKAFY